LESSARIDRFLDAALLLHDTGRADLVELLGAESFYWRKIISRAIETHLGPALKCQLETNHLWDRLPPEAAETLSNVAELNRARNARVISTIREIVTIFRLAGVECVFLKGAACLASGVYPDPAWRYMSDIDLLVGKSSFRGAIDVLFRSGYHLCDTDLLTDPIVGNHYHALESPAGVAVEVHRCFRILNTVLESGAVLGDAVESNSAGFKVYVPRKEHIVVHNVLHCVEQPRDRLWPSVHRIADLRLLIQIWAHTLDWNLVNRHLTYNGESRELRTICRSAFSVLQAIQSGASIFEIRGKPASTRERALLKLSALRYIDPVYHHKMWFFGKVSRARHRLTTWSGSRWLFHRLMSRRFWSQLFADLRQV
jgi:hypothetical protein